jgi:single-strand DNA-binding protein
MVISLSGVAQATILGRMTADPELKETNNGKQVVNFSLAVNRRFSKEDTADFFDVTAWGRNAENVAAYKSKGDLIFVQGDLQNDKWEKDGQTRVKTKLVAQTIQFVSNKGENAPSTNGQETANELAEVPF